METELEEWCKDLALDTQKLAARVRELELALKKKPVRDVGTQTCDGPQ